MICIDILRHERIACIEDGLIRQPSDEKCIGCDNLKTIALPVGTLIIIETR